MKSKVLVIGGGGREHAIIAALRRSAKVGEVFCAPGNVGIGTLAQCVSIGDCDIEGLLTFAKKIKPDLIIVGPENPLSAGITDCFEEEGFLVFGPSSAAAKIESSKSFAKELMRKYNIPTAEYKTFDDYQAACMYLNEVSFPIVLKYDGLAAGKGVVIAENFTEAKKTLGDMLLDEKFGKGKVVIEEFLSGPEFSFMCFVSGKNVYPMEIAQDHKRAFEGDKGPNTGGMGAYSPVSFITEEDRAFALEKIMKPTAEALYAEGTPFKGVLYGGLIKTQNGIKVIEFNCRFGDPETEVVLPRLITDFYDICNSVASGTSFPELKWNKQVAAGFVLASKGYPGHYEKGFAINGLENINDTHISIFHMGTSLKDGKLVTAGGRVLMITSLADTFEQARKQALAGIARIKCDNLFFRRDIGNQIMKI